MIETAGLALVALWLSIGGVFFSISQSLNHKPSHVHKAANCRQLNLEYVVDCERHFERVLVRKIQEKLDIEEQKINRKVFINE